MAPAPTHPDIFAPFYSLGCVAAYAKVHDEGRLRATFDFQRITPIAAGAVTAWLDGLPAEPGVFLLSEYVWNHRVSMAVAREVKRRWPGAFVIAGGPHVPRDEAHCRAFFAEHPPGDLDAFYREVVDFVGREFGVRPAGTDLDAVCTANREVLPRPGRAFPARVPLAHDVAAYLGRLRPLASLDVPPPDFRRLRDHGPGVLDLAAENACTGWAHSDVWVGNDSLLLASNLRL